MITMQLAIRDWHSEPNRNLPRLGGNPCESSNNAKCAGMCRAFSDTHIIYLQESYAFYENFQDQYSWLQKQRIGKKARHSQKTSDDGWSICIVNTTGSWSVVLYHH